MILITKNNKINKMLILQLILILIGVLAFLVTKTGIGKLIPPCMIREAIGVICPTCGVTRCVSNILAFNFEAAFKYHPMVFILTIYLGVIDVVYIINTIFNKEFLKVFYPSIKYFFIFYGLFIFQYIFRLIIILKYNGLQYL